MMSTETLPEKKFYSPELVRLCLCSFLFFTSFNMIIPELPSFLRAMGGEQYIGLIIGLFTVTAGGARPFSGKWADQVGRVPVMLIGAAVSCLCGFLYVFVSSVFAFLALRFVHGFSTGFTPTGTTAYVADIVPGGRRGEAMGLLGLAGSLGMAAGPAVGSSLAFYYGLDSMFYVSAFTGFLALVLIMGIKETLADRKKFDAGMWKITRSEVYEPRVIAPAFVLFLTVLSFGVVITLVPDLCDRLQLRNRGIFFTVFTLSSVLVRFSAGKLSDRIGREKILLFSTFILCISMVLMAWANTAVTLLAGAVLFGLAQGINSPAVMAWCIDLSNPKHIGRAMATVYIAMEIGIGSGAIFSGWISQSFAGGHAAVFMGAAFCGLIAFLFLLRRLSLKGRPSS